MNRTWLRNTYRLFVFTLLLLAILPESLGQVSNIGGVINRYSKVTAVGADYVDLADNLPGFEANDTVLLIQMKGAEVTLETSIYGTNIASSLGDYGYYEFLIVDRVETSPDRVVFRNNLIGSYNAQSFVQLVTVERFAHVNVQSELTCQPWDSLSGTGGVLAIIADNNIYLNSDINVSFAGFAGGISDIINGSTIINGEEFPDLLDFSEAVAEAARKGKGIASHNQLGARLFYEDFARGKGRFGNGGGGGNGRFAGGGGGSSYGTGGVGGNDLDGIYGRGYPGEDPNFIQITNRYNPILLGGGGGAGGRSVSGTASDGGKGGGIIFILADTIIGNGYSIISDGEDVSPVAAGDGGAGGGGAAGAIVISSSYGTTSDLNIRADGGNGGHTENFNGYGGGGSGGLIFTNKNLSIESTVNTSVIPGKEGMTNYTGGEPVIPSGDEGQVSDSLIMRLNGFLFNSIVSDVSQSLIDSICSGNVPYRITGTTPVGGREPYIYEWQRRTDNGSWGIISGAGEKDLVPAAAETDTVFFRRIVKDSSSPDQIIDTSKAVMFIVQPLITGNVIAYDTIICTGQDPDPLIPVDLLHGGNLDSGRGDSLFWWGSSSLNSDYNIWPAATGVNDERVYDPSALSETTYYYRVVQSGRCVDTSNIVTVTVLPSISGNTIAADQTICEDRLFTDLSGPEPTGGDGIYRYEWRTSNDDLNYVAADGTVDQQSYNPDETVFPRDEDRFIRRFVWSGDDDVCVDSSAYVTLKMWSDISGNIINTDQTICSLDPVALLSGDVLGGGDLASTHTFLWEESTDNITWGVASGTNNTETYQPAGLTDTTWYRRIVWLSECTDTSNVVVINVHPPITGNSISTVALEKDTTICSGQDPDAIIGTLTEGGDNTYIYSWEQSINNIDFSVADGIADGIDYDPGILTQTTYYRRIVSSGECSHTSDTVTINVLEPISLNTITPDQTICYNTVPDELNGSVPSGGDGFYTYLWQQSDDNLTWVDAAGINSNLNYSPGALVQAVYYRRIVRSGLANCCEDIAEPVMIGIYPLPTGSIVTVADDTSCAGDDVIINLALTGTAPYDAVLNDGNGNYLSFSAGTDSYEYTYNPTEPLDYIYRFESLSDANGCMATDLTGAQNHKVYEIPVSDAGSDDEICGLSYSFSANASAGTGIWYSTNALITSSSDASSANNEVSVADYGTWTFWWKETNWQCSDSSAVDISFYEAPQTAYAGQDTILAPYTYSYILGADVPLVGTGIWSLISSSGSPLIQSPSDPATEISGLGDGVNEFRWTVTNGVCPPVEDDVQITINFININSGFSPNGDARNDIFDIEGIENTSNEFVVTDMSGVIVYRKVNYDNTWEGFDMHNNPLPDGTYYYFLRIKEPVEKDFKGYVIIKRSF